jgi:hypothetical protein
VELFNSITLIAIVCAPLGRMLGGIAISGESWWDPVAGFILRFDR